MDPSNPKPAIRFTFGKTTPNAAAGMCSGHVLYA
jgi:hypothetical protein